MSVSADYSGGRERRQHPRWPAREGVEGQLQTRGRVRLIDISANGALLAGDVALPPGAQARLRSTIGSVPFTPTVEIRRVAPPRRDGTAKALGVSFVSMDARSRQCLEAFLKLAGS